MKKHIKVFHWFPHIICILVILFIKNSSLFIMANGQTFPLLPESETRFYVSTSDVYLDFILVARY